MTPPRSRQTRDQLVQQKLRVSKVLCLVALVFPVPDRFGNPVTIDLRLPSGERVNSREVRASTVKGLGLGLYIAKGLVNPAPDAAASPPELHRERA